MKQNLILNIIPFASVPGKKSFAFYRERKDDTYYPIFKDDLYGFLDDKLSEADLLQLEKLYTDFQPAREGAIQLDIDLSVSHRFANHYYRFLIRNYFVGKADIMHQNFTSETEVWYHNKEKSTAKYNVYNQFTLKVQHSRVTTGPELVLSYDGTTKVFAKPVSEIYKFKTHTTTLLRDEGCIDKG